MIVVFVIETIRNPNNIIKVLWFGLIHLLVIRAVCQWTSIDPMMMIKQSVLGELLGHSMLFLYQLGLRLFIYANYETNGIVKIVLGVCALTFSPRISRLISLNLSYITPITVCFGTLLSTASFSIYMITLVLVDFVRSR
jgi:hypothetical protein